MSDETPRPKPRKLSQSGARRLYRDAALKEGRGFTPDKQSQYLELVAGGISRSKAAQMVGCAWKTVRDYAAKDPAFAAAEVEAEALAIEPVEEKLRDLALDGHMVAIMFLLQNRSDGRWRDMRKVEKKVTHEGTVQLEAGQVLQNIAELTARLEERAALRGLPAGPDPDVIDVDPVEE